jgi:hypothetical protein
VCRESATRACSFLNNDSAIRIAKRGIQQQIDATLRNRKPQHVGFFICVCGCALVG